MNAIRELVINLFQSNNMAIPDDRMKLFDNFLLEEQNIASVQAIIQNQNQLMAQWKLQDRITAILQQPVRLLNATVGKPYEARFDLDASHWEEDISAYEFEGLQQVGLAYDEKTRQITGVPIQSGDLKIVFKFKVNGQPQEASFQEKSLMLIVNPDPKTLWKNLESDKNDPYWKEDNVTVLAPLGERHVLVSSKRGRSHANIGSFREDDFAFSVLENEWRLVVVADGAGSAKLSRKGSAIACQCVVEYFTSKSSVEGMAELDELLVQHTHNPVGEIPKQLSHCIYKNLGQAAFLVHKKLEAFAQEVGIPLKDLNTTLVFALVKKYATGYVFVSFGVGDCPMAVLNKDVSEVTVLNWLDVGEFGGGTRFITMPEIFHHENFATRFRFAFLEDYSYLMLMSDGIYDPKFEVEDNLGNIKKWQEFLADLQGKNEDGAKVELSIDNTEIIEQFSQWMDFWSAGNHDDRTLAIVF